MAPPQVQDAPSLFTPGEQKMIAGIISLMDGDVPEIDYQILADFVNIKYGKNARQAAKKLFVKIRESTKLNPVALTAIASVMDIDEDENDEVGENEVAVATVTTKKTTKKKAAPGKIVKKGIARVVRKPAAAKAPPTKRASRAKIATKKNPISGLLKELEGDGDDTDVEDDNLLHHGQDILPGLPASKMKNALELSVDTAMSSIKSDVLPAKMPRNTRASAQARKKKAPEVESAVQADEEVDTVGEQVVQDKKGPTKVIFHIKKPTELAINKQVEEPVEEIVEHKSPPVKRATRTKKTADVEKVTEAPVKRTTRSKKHAALEPIVEAALEVAKDPAVSAHSSARFQGATKGHQRNNTGEHATEMSAIKNGGSAGGESSKAVPIKTAGSATLTDEDHARNNGMSYASWMLWKENNDYSIDLDDDDPYNVNNGYYGAPTPPDYSQS